MHLFNEKLDSSKATKHIDMPPIYERKVIFLHICKFDEANQSFLRLHAMLLHAQALFIIYVFI
jgi:hypothetical protein